MKKKINDPAVPLRSTSLGYTLTFIPKVSLFGPPAEHACLAGLQRIGFSGRCELYYRETTLVSQRPIGRGEFAEREQFVGNAYLLGVGLKNRQGCVVPSLAWWEKFCRLVADACAEDAEVEFFSGYGGFARLRALRQEFLHLCAVEFADGCPVSILEDPEARHVARLPPGMPQAAPPQTQTPRPGRSRAWKPSPRKGVRKSGRVILLQAPPPSS